MVVQRKHDTLYVSTETGEFKLGRSAVPVMRLRQHRMRSPDQVFKPARILSIERGAALEIVERVVAAGPLEQLAGQRLGILRRECGRASARHVLCMTGHAVLLHMIAARTMG